MADATGKSVSAGGASEREKGLRRSLGKAQIVMIGLGGAIGTGLFMGSGLAVGYAGPAVIVSYALAGFVALVMVFSLSEMAVVHPTAGSFGTYAETYLNPWAGFVVRYTYWIAQAIAVGGEAVAAGLYMQYWFPVRARLDVGGRLLPGAALFQFALGRQLRHAGVVAGPDQGGGDRPLHHPRARAASPASASSRPSACTTSPGCRAASCRRAWRDCGWPSPSGSSPSTASRSSPSPPVRPRTRRSRSRRRCARWCCGCFSSTCSRSRSS